MKEEKDKMTFVGYYRNLQMKERATLRNTVVTSFGISYPTFYSKLSRGNYSPLERKEIEHLCNTSFNWNVSCID